MHQNWVGRSKTVSVWRWHHFIGKQNSKDKPLRFPSPRIQSSTKLGTTVKRFCWVIKVTHHLTLSRWAQWNCKRRKQGRQRDSQPKDSAYYCWPWRWGAGEREPRTVELRKTAGWRKGGLSPTATWNWILPQDLQLRVQACCSLHMGPREGLNREPRRAVERWDNNWMLLHATHFVGTCYKGSRKLIAVKQKGTKRRAFLSPVNLSLFNDFS